MYESHIRNSFEFSEIFNISGRQLFLKPVGGLSNRLRAMDSAIAYAKQLDFKLTIFWNTNDGCAINFKDIFLPLSAHTVVEICSNDSYDILQHIPFDLIIPFSDGMSVSKQIKANHSRIQLNEFDKQFIKRFDFLSRTSNFSRIFLTSCHRFFVNKCQYQNFIPIPKINTKIQTHSKKLLDAIGLHIRKPDYLKVLRANSLSIFSNVIEKELHKNNKTLFFLSTDCPKTKEYLLNNFPDNIYSINHKNLRRDDKYGMQSAIIDLYCLSKTKKIYGSYFSTFSQTAAEMGKIELIIPN